MRVHRGLQGNDSFLETTGFVRERGPCSGEHVIRRILHKDILTFVCRAPADTLR
jgi:hypothetical protein